MIKVCFISLRSYPLFKLKSKAYFGGAELQISLLAKELARDKKFRVSVINGDYGQEAIINQGRLKLLKTKLFDFFRILKLADADVYVERTINPKIIPVYLFCRLFHKKFIYMVAHDWDLKHPVIKLADLIMTQHEQQQKSLKFNSLIMPSLIMISKAKKALKRKYILWVGRADEWKRPLEFIELARLNPQEQFVMICREGKVKLPIDDLPNLKIIPSVPASKILNYFWQAKFFVNTSLAEGFPNTFLQAGITKTPVLSFKVNPDNYLVKYKCGIIGRQNLKQLLAKQKLLSLMGQNHYSYVNKYHRLNNKINIFKRALAGLMILILGLFIYVPALKAQPNLPKSDKIISVTIAKNQTQGQFKIDETEPEKPIYYSVINEGKKPISPQVVINGKDWFTNQAIVNYALKDIDWEKDGDEEKALALYHFVVENRYHWQTPLYATSYYFLENPVRYFNVWGYGYCSNSASVLIQLLSLAGLETRLVNLVDHVVSEVFYDGQWHVLDPDLEVYYRNAKGEIASVEEIVNNPKLLNYPIWLREMSNVDKKVIWDVNVYSYAKPAQRNTPVAVSMTSNGYQKEISYRLKPNEEIRFYYDFKGKYYWGFSDKEPPEFTNGILISKNKGGLFRFELPFPIVASYIYRPNLCRDIFSPRFSLDGKQWQKLMNCNNDTVDLSDLFPVGENSYPTERYFLLLPFSLTEYQLITQFQVAPKSIPLPHSGLNEVKIKNPLQSAIQLNFGY